jgi:hypothetical protein
VQNVLSHPAQVVFTQLLKLKFLALTQLVPDVFAREDLSGLGLIHDAGGGVYTVAVDVPVGRCSDLADVHPDVKIPLAEIVGFGLLREGTAQPAGSSDGCFGAMELGQGAVTDKLDDIPSVPINSVPGDALEELHHFDSGTLVFVRELAEADDVSKPESG